MKKVNESKKIKNVIESTGLLKKVDETGLADEANVQKTIQKAFSEIVNIGNANKGTSNWQVDLFSFHGDELTTACNKIKDQLSVLLTAQHDLTVFADTKRRGAK